MLTRLIALKRYQKALLICLAYTGLVLFSLWLAFALRLGEFYLPFSDNQWLLFAAAPLIAVPVFIRLGLYRAVIRYIGHRAMVTIGYANALVALLWSLLPFYINRFLELELFSPRSLPFIFWMVLCITIGGSRQMARWFVSGSFRVRQGNHVLIYGAGKAGAQLAMSMAQSAEIRVLGFVDDETELHGQQIAGFPVLGGREVIAAVKQDYASLEVLLAMPTATREQRRRILEALEQVEVAVRTMPSLDNVALGRVSLTDLDEIDITDLLGRDPVLAQQDLLQASVTQKSVLVTGAGGSIGSELCRQLIELSPRRLVLLEHTEFALFNVEQELLKRIDKRGLAVELVPLLGSVLDDARLDAILQGYAVDTIYHAAAYKHVPLVEQNVIPGVSNNVLGTQAVAAAALRHGVERFVLVSTDKAVRPTNSMGASKRLAEMVLQGMQQEPDNRRTRFIMVRFGNVLGSSGSVIPLFKRQIEQGGPVTVTHSEITRYFMTIPEAASLVIQAGSLGTGGDLFVLDMGDPVRIADLARRMIRLSGYCVGSEQQGGIDICYTGLRPGEKLFEELLIGDAVAATRHPRILVAREQGPDAQQARAMLTRLRQLVTAQDVQAVRDLLLEQVSGFNPQCAIQDLLWHTGQRSNEENRECS